MEFDLIKAIQVLEKTPKALNGLLHGISDEWVNANEGPDTWSPYDVVGHLIHGEKTDWIPRAQIILGHGTNKTFQPFDRFAQMQDRGGKTLAQLLQEFEELREKNLTLLREMDLSESNLLKVGVHPAFGPVTLKELLATWVAHDLNHIAQICRTMAKQYKAEVGPWVAYLRILNQ